MTDRKKLTTIVYTLVAVKTALCLMPGNDWLSASTSLSWDVHRNIPLAFLGSLMIVLSYQKAKETKDAVFRYTWLTITLSFGFYIPVIPWTDTYPLVGTLVTPKTCAYV